MIQHPCWSDTEIGRIVKPDAEEITDHVFRAVHCPAELQIADTVDGTPIAESPESMLERFLDPKRDYVQAVVIGESGTGKSHLIQWLRLNIPSDERTVLLTIPKTGTSLRGIIERIISYLPIENRAEYKDRLEKSGTYATSKEAKVSKFLDALAWAIEHGGLVTDPEDVDLSTVLPDVLRDPHFRKQFFIRPGGAVDQIVEHVFVEPDKRDTNFDRREFQLGDLPLDGVYHRDASRNAKDAIDFIKGEHGMDVRAIALMNRSLNAAIAQTLHFSADHLIDLMNALRRYLAQKNKRLVLLIEDFARTQGIDTALLQALITPPGQGDEVLCELRWAMAITTGPFKNMAQTVRTRTTFLVDMDRSAPASLAQFTAGYLNALRFGEAQLREMPMRGAMPSRCSLCEKRPDCFAAFGEVDGIGLFPFTEGAINVMAERSESRIDEVHFNPRKFLRSVIETVVSKHYDELQSGEFPSPTLLKRIGGAGVVKPIDRQNIAQADSTYSDRRITLLELWDGTGRVGNLAPGIHEAFGIPPLDGLPNATTVGDRQNVSGNAFSSAVGQVNSLVTSSVAPEIEAIRRWGSDDAMLSQNLAHDLRELVFSALDGAIDWDSLGYKKSMVSSSTAASSIPFRNRSINFQNQQTQRLQSLVMLDVTTADALALEALLMHKLHDGGWDFEDGGQLLANLLETVQRWKSDIEKQLKSIFSGGPTWQPLIAIAELLTLGAYISGKLKIGETQLETVVGRIWDQTAFSAPVCMYKPFGDVTAVLAKNFPKLLDTLRGLASGTKGGASGNFVRATPVVEAVRLLRQRSFQLSQTPPDELPSKELKELADLYRRVKNEFIPSLVIEKESWAAWIADIEATIGSGITISSLKDALSTAILAVGDQSINAGASRKILAETLENIKPRALDAAVAHARVLKEANAAEALIRIVSIGESRHDVDRLCEHASEFLGRAEAAFVNQREELNLQSVAGLRESEMKIEQALESLIQFIIELETIPEGKA